ncbi:hypothetical protein N2152v2_009607 [Parachlorella kessleri]
MAQLGPLRERATSLYTLCKERTVAEQQRWLQSDKSNLKLHAKGLKEALDIQNQAVEAQQLRVTSLANQNLSPSTVHAGFNVIRARLTSEGKAWATDDLRAEKDRLTKALNQLAIDIAAAKAEIKSQRRAEEVEIWETQLVALQDTLRVYKQEINIIEVELLGREQQERIEADRVAAEASGVAQLQRLQEQALQTRVRFNRAKQRYHFPPPFGYNITFGGGGIYGALKDITLSEIHGNVSITAEVIAGPPTSMAGRGSGTGGAQHQAAASTPRARLVIQFGVAQSAIGNLGASGSSGSSSTDRATPPRVPQQQQQQQQHPPPVAPGNVQRREVSGSATAAAIADGGRAAAVGVVGRRDSSGAESGRGPTSLSRLSGSSRAASASLTPSSSPMRPLGPLSNGMLAASSAGSAGQLQAGAAVPDGGGGMPSPTMTPQRKQSKAKAMAVRFLNKLGSKKDKYQRKEQPQLQPLQPSDSDVGAKRTLASKLLHRRTTSRVEQPGSPKVERGLGSSVDMSVGGSHRASGFGLLGGIPSQQDTESLGTPSEDLIEEELAAEAAEERQREPGSSPGHLLASASHPSMERLSSPGLTREALEFAANQQEEDGSSSTLSSSSDDEGGGGRAGSSGFGVGAGGAGEPQLAPGLERGAWLRNRGSSGAEAASTWGGESESAAGASDVGLDDGDAIAAAPASMGRQGVHVVGRVNGFGLIGERGSKVPNLSLVQGDVEGHVFVRFVYEYTKLGGWQPGEKPVFDVQHLKTRLKGSNVPMPDALIKTILRMAIPGLIQRKLLGAVPRELGSYLLAAGQGFHATADVALVAAPLSVLDADLSFEVRGPAKSAAEARKQQQKYAAAKEARRLLGLSLPQAQILAELFRPKSGVLELPHAVSIFQLIALQRAFDRQPELYSQLCQALNTGYQLLADRVGHDVGDFTFRAFMDGPVSKLRRKPSRIRVIMHDMALPLNLDGLLNAVRDYTQRALEELLIKGPQANPRDNPEAQEGETPLDEQLEILHAWHAWMLQELSHFKSKFQGAGGTLLGAASSRGFSGGVENAFYEGPLRLRMPVNMQLDADGAFSFEVPLPSPEGAIGEFVDALKSRLVPAHLRPPLGALNWIPPTDDSEVDGQMVARMEQALAMIQDVLEVLRAKIAEQGAEALDSDPVIALMQPRTAVGDRLGRFIVNRLRVHVRLDERRISEILQGIDQRSMGSGFLTTAGRILGHLGDVMTLAFTPAAPSGPGSLPAAAPDRPQQYLLQFESSDISRLRADVQSLGFQSLITPGKAVRLVHATIRAFLLAFKRMAASHPQLRALDEKFMSWYQHMTRESLDVSLCLDLKGSVQGGNCVVTLSGTADEALLRETSPLVAINDLELVSAAVAMFGGPGAAGGGGSVLCAKSGKPVAAGSNDIESQDLEAELEAFMRRQAEIESGVATRKVEPGKVLGADEISEEEAKEYCREVVKVLRTLKERRDMGLNEVRLTVAIEDPRARERRLMGMEDSSGVSRDEMAAALLEVAEGRVPTDRIALRELCREMSAWPFLDKDAPTGDTGSEAAPAAGGSSGGDLTPAALEAQQAWRRKALVIPPVGRDPSEKPQSPVDLLPDWVGYGALYAVSALPVVIAGTVILVLFLNSLR